MYPTVYALTIGYTYFVNTNYVMLYYTILYCLFSEFYIYTKYIYKNNLTRVVQWISNFASRVKQ